MALFALTENVTESPTHFVAEDGCPLMVGASRKRTIGALSGEAPADNRLGGSIAFALKAAEQGAQIVRVHDVFETVQALRIWRGLRDQALTPRV